MKVSFWLKSKAEGVQELPKMPEECLSEIKNSGLRKIHCMLTEIDKLGVNNIINCKDFSINCKDFSSLHHLLAVTALVIKFCRILLAKLQGVRNSSEYDHVKTAETLWLQVSQRPLPTAKNFTQLRFGLFQGENLVLIRRK